MARHHTQKLGIFTSALLGIFTSALTRWRFYRFFPYIHIDAGVMARMVVALLGIADERWTLTIDRTNWQLGKTTINILMIAIIWHGVGIVLIGTFLPKKGNSSTQERTRLLDRLRRTFPDMKVTTLIGDRGFQGVSGSFREFQGVYRG